MEARLGLHTTRRLGATRVLWFSVVVGRQVTSVNDHFGSNCPNRGAAGAIGGGSLPNQSFFSSTR